MSTNRLSKFLTVAATTLSVGLATSSAFAQEEFAGEPAIAEDARGPRFRFGIGNVAGMVWTTRGVDMPQFIGLPSLPGIAIRSGVQINDHYAIFHQTSFSLLLPSFRNSAMFEVTPVDYFSVGAGVSVDWYALELHLFGGSPPPPTPLQGWSIGVPVRLALNIPFARSGSGSRVGVSWNVDLTPAYYFGEEEYLKGFQFGAVTGLSFEVF